MSKSKRAAAAKPDPAEDVLDGVIETIKVSIDDDGKFCEVGDAVPPINSPEWTPFLMGKLLDDESYDGMPTVEGLRRLANEYVGEVLESTTAVAQSPNAQNGHHACMVHTLTVSGFDGLIRRVSGCADVFEGNGDDAGYAWRYAAATCETRAESRAYRRLLRLRHVCTAEEVSRVPEDQSGMTGRISDRQKYFIDMICRRLDVNALAFVNMGKKKYKSVDDVPYDTAVVMNSHLSTLQQKRDAIPADIRGYDPNWLSD